VVKIEICFLGHSGVTKSFGEDDNCALWLIKTDANGNENRDKIFGGSGDNMGFSVRQTNIRFLDRDKFCAIIYYAPISFLPKDPEDRPNTHSYLDFIR
jgi:hypothetical protein